MKNVCLFTVGILLSFSTWSFETGSYSGINKDISCNVDLEQRTDRVLVQYDCITPGGLVLESEGVQTYMFGNFSEEVEDESGRYLVKGSGSDQLLEYMIVKLSNNSTWLEQIKNLGNSKIHYNMSLDNDYFINLTLTKNN